MKEIGMIDKLFEPYLRTTKKSCPNEQIIGPILKIPKSVGIITTFFLYMLVLIGFVCAIMTFLMEKVHQKCH